MKKVIEGLLIFISIILFGGCGNITFTTEKSFNCFEKEVKEIHASSDQVVSMSYLGGNGKQLIYKESKKDNDKENVYMSQIYLYDYEKESISSLSLVSGALEYVLEAFISEEGRIILWGGKDYIYILDSEGELEKKIDLMALSANMTNGVNGKKEICPRRVVEFQNRYFILDLQGIYVLDEDYNGILYKEGSYELLASTVTNPRIISREDYKIYSYNSKKNLFEVNGRLTEEDGETELDYIWVSDGNQEYDWFYYNYYPFGNLSDSYSNLIGVKNGKYNVIFNFDSMGIVQNNIERYEQPALVSDGKSGFWIVTKAGDEKTLYVSHLIKDIKEHNYSLKNNKEVISIGGLSFPSVMPFLIDHFNADSDRYYIEIVDYLRQYGSYEDALVQLNLDILKEGTLDGYSLYGIDYKNLIKKEVLQNLNEYFETSIHPKNMFDPQFIEMITNEDGNIFYIFPNYIVTGYAYSDNIDFDDLSQYEELITDSHTFLGGDSEELLCNIICYSGTRYIDEEKKEIHINEDGFKSLLHILKKQKDTRLDTNNAKLMVFRNEADSIEAQLLYPTWFAYYEQLYGDDLTWSSSGAEGPVIDPMSFMLGVDARSQNKDGVYAFLDYIFTPEIYREYFYYDGFSALNVIWDTWKIRSTAKEECIDNFGEKVYVGRISLGYGETMIQIEPGSFTESDFERMRSTVREARWIDPMPDKYISVISEEAKMYFEGQRDLDETCRIIEERLKNALYE